MLAEVTVSEAVTISLADGDVEGVEKSKAVTSSPTSSPPHESQRDRPQEINVHGTTRRRS